MKLYRFASPAPLLWNLVKSVVFVGAFWGTFLVAAPWGVARASRHWHALQTYLIEPQQELGIAVFVASFLLGCWALLAVAVQGKGTPMPFDAPRKLVTGGPYAWMRNPLLMAGMAQGVAAALYTGALLILPCVAVGIGGCQFVVWRLERRELERAFGREFEAYRRSVRYWLPMRRRWVPTRLDGRPISLDEINVTPGGRRYEG